MMYLIEYKVSKLDKFNNCKNQSSNECKGSDGLMAKVSASQPRNPGFESHTDHDHESSYDTNSGWFKEEDSE